MQRSTLIILGVLLAACGDDAEDTAPDAGPRDAAVSSIDSGMEATRKAAEAGQVDAAAKQRALYVIASWVSMPESVSTHVKVVPDLAVDTKVNVQSNSIEQPGYGDAKVVGNRLYVSSGEAPTVTSYTIDAEGKFSEETTLDFTRYAARANIFQMVFVSPTQSYLVGDDSWVRWNPSTMQIEADKSIPFPDSIQERDGIAPYYAFDRGFALRGKYLFHAISWFDFANYKVAASSVIAVIDTETNKLESLLDAPCPGLDTATADEAGNIYYSGWAFAPGARYMNDGAKSCAVMIPAASNTVSGDFKLDFAALTGHEAIGLRFLGDSKLLMQVFDENKRSFNPSTDTISDWVYADSWFFATYDLLTREYKELKNLGYVGGGYYSERFGDQFFLLSKRDAETDYLQLHPDGTTTKGITVNGWASRAYLVR